MDSWELVIDKLIAAAILVAQAVGAGFGIVRPYLQEAAQQLADLLAR